MTQQHPIAVAKNGRHNPDRTGVVSGDRHRHVLTRADLAPIGSGPLELTNVYCQRVRRDFAQVAMISPDGRAIVYLQGGGRFTAERKVLHVARLDPVKAALRTA